MRSGISSPAVELSTRCIAIQALPSGVKLRLAWAFRVTRWSPTLSSMGLGPARMSPVEGSISARNTGESTVPGTTEGTVVVTTYSRPSGL